MGGDFGTIRARFSCALAHSRDARRCLLDDPRPRDRGVYLDPANPAANSNSRLADPYSSTGGEAYPPPRRTNTLPPVASLILFRLVCPDENSIGGDWRQNIAARPRPSAGRRCRRRRSVGRRRRSVGRRRRSTSRTIPLVFFLLILFFLLFHRVGLVPRRILIRA